MAATLRSAQVLYMAIPSDAPKITATKITFSSINESEIASKIMKMKIEGPKVKKEREFICLCACFSATKFFLEMIRSCDVITQRNYDSSFVSSKYFFRLTFV